MKDDRQEKTQMLLEQMREEIHREPRRAVVLGGGGARGSYQIGVWKALRELDYRYDIVAGTSVGALNGAMMVQGDYDAAVMLWESLRTENVIEVPDGFGERPGLDSLHDFLTEFLKKGGVDPAPLERLLREYLSEERVRSSPVDFGLVTVEYPTLRPLVLTKENIPQGKLYDYLMASAACFPAMKKRQIDDKQYIDGAYHSNIPIEIALEKGADEVVAVDLDALGIVRPVHLHNQKIRYVRCHWPLGVSLNFSPELAKRNIRLGYLDTMKAFGRLEGQAYAFAAGELSGNPERLENIRKRFEAFFALENGISRLAWKRVKSAVSRRGDRSDSEAESGWQRSDIPGVLELSGELMELSPEAVYSLEGFHAGLLEKAEEAKGYFQEFLSAFELSMDRLLRDAGSARKLLETFRENDKQFLVVFLMECIEKRYTLPGGMDTLNLLGAAFSRELAAAVYLTALKEQ